MSADSTSALGAAGLARAPAMPMPKPQPTAPKEAAPADGAQASVAVMEKIGASLAVPQKAELTIDPQQRRNDLHEAIASINQKMREDGRALAFSYDDAIDRTVVTVKNSETGKVIRQIPNEAVLRVAHNLADVKGLMQDNHV